MPQAILDGKTQTGVSLIQVNEQFDTGDIIFQIENTVQPTDTTYTLANRLITLGTETFIQLIKQHTDGNFPRMPQPRQRSSYTQPYTSKDAQIDWSDNPITIDRKVRAYYPKPIAWTYMADLIKAYAPTQSISPKWIDIRVQIHAGSIIDSQYVPQTIQIEGKNPIPWHAFSAGYLS